MERHRSSLEEKMQELPASPGVYLMKGNKGQVLYVGKALSLRHRIRSYFQKGHSLDLKTQKMVAQVADMDYLVTDSEMEALILESTLIKEHRPRYNILFKDDKQYPHLKVTVQEPYPRIYLEREVVNDGSRYFGPYTNSRAVRTTLDLLQKIFPLRTCRQELTPGRSKGRPCLNFEIDRCLAPCQGEVEPEDYRQLVKQVLLFLEGRQDSLIRELREKMERAAASLDFERAALWRDRLRTLEDLLQQQKVVTEDRIDRDVLALARAETDGNLSLVQAFFLREGKLVGKEQFFLKNTAQVGDGEIMHSFIQQFYGPASHIPREVLLSAEAADRELLEDWLKSLKGGRVYLRIPRRGKKRGLVEMALKNARLYLKQQEASASQREGLALKGLEELARLLDLEAPPQRIEGYDISNLQGGSLVASRVVFSGGKPHKDGYRRYQIKTVKGPDDYASMREVLLRRFRRGSERAHYPDLLLIDGGKGQLGAAREALQAADVSLPLISLAKEEEIIYRGDGGEPLKLPASSPALRLLQQVRDESHRFALSYHRLLRNREARFSALDVIPGIGPQKKKALLKHFKSLKAIKGASLEELAGVRGITPALARKIQAALSEEALP